MSAVIPKHLRTMVCPYKEYTFLKNPDFITAPQITKRVSIKNVLIHVYELLTPTCKESPPPSLEIPTCQVPFS